MGHTKRAVKITIIATKQKHSDILAPKIESSSAIILQTTHSVQSLTSDMTGLAELMNGS